MQHCSRAAPVTFTAPTTDFAMPAAMLLLQASAMFGIAPHDTRHAARAPLRVTAASRSRYSASSVRHMLRGCASDMLILRALALLLYGARRARCRHCRYMLLLPRQGVVHGDIPIAMMPMKSHDGREE